MSKSIEYQGIKYPAKPVYVGDFKFNGKNHIRGQTLRVLFHTDCGYFLSSPINTGLCQHMFTFHFSCCLHRVRLVDVSTNTLYPLDDQVGICLTKGASIAIILYA